MRSPSSAEIMGITNLVNSKSSAESPEPRHAELHLGSPDTFHPAEPLDRETSSRSILHNSPSQDIHYSSSTSSHIDEQDHPSFSPRSQSGTPHSISAPLPLPQTSLASNQSNHTLPPVAYLPFVSSQPHNFNRPLNETSEWRPRQHEAPVALPLPYLSSTSRIYSLVDSNRSPYPPHHPQVPNYHDQSSYISLPSPNSTGNISSSSPYPKHENTAWGQRPSYPPTSGDELLHHYQPQSRQKEAKLREQQHAAFSQVAAAVQQQHQQHQYHHYQQDQHPFMDSEKPYQCRSCTKCFARRSDLSRHERIHTGDRPHACPFPNCDRRFIQRSALTVHTRVHTGEKPHMCESCGRSFGDSSSLARHRRTHTGRRPYKCPYATCQKTFTRRTTLTRHQSQHTETLQEAAEAASTAAALANKPNTTKMVHGMEGNLSQLMNSQDDDGEEDDVESREGERDEALPSPADLSHRQSPIFDAARAAVQDYEQSQQHNHRQSLYLTAPSTSASSPRDPYTSPNSASHHTPPQQYGSPSEAESHQSIPPSATWHHRSSPIDAAAPV